MPNYTQCNENNYVLLFNDIDYNQLSTHKHLNIHVVQYSNAVFSGTPLFRTPVLRSLRTLTNVSNCAL